MFLVPRAGEGRKERRKEGREEGRNNSFFYPDFLR